MTSQIAIGQRSSLPKLHKLLPLFNSQCGENVQAARIGHQRVKAHATLIGPIRERT
jgi:hypothetical protein